MRANGTQETIRRTVRMNHEDARCEISHTALFRPGKDEPHSSLGASSGGDPLRGAGRVEGGKDTSRPAAFLAL